MANINRFTPLDTPKVYCETCLVLIVKGKESMKRYLAKKFCCMKCHWDNKDSWEMNDFTSTKKLNIPKKRV